MNAEPRRRALFLDRDGVINVEKNYVHRVEDFDFVPGIFELCRAAAELGLVSVVVTNQAGIGRGYYTEADFQALTAWMLDRFRAQGIAIAGVYHCPFHPTAGVGGYRRESFDRKPKPGMFLRAGRELALDLGSSVLVGDKDSDMAAGRAAGVPHLIKLVASDLPSPPGRAGAGVDPGGAEDHPRPAVDVTTVRSLHEAADHLRSIVGRRQ